MLQLQVTVSNNIFILKKLILRGVKLFVFNNVNVSYIYFLIIIKISITRPLFMLFYVKTAVVRCLSEIYGIWYNILFHLSVL